MQLHSNKLNLSKLPLLTADILSWNRLKYLRATLESAKRCIQYPNLEWIVIDNLSTEEGLREYLESLDWVDQLIFLKSSHIEAMNEIIARAKGELLLLWPEDIQFIVEGDWMLDCAEILISYPWIGSVVLVPLRNITVKKIWSLQRFLRWQEFAHDFKKYGFSFRRQRILTSSRGFNFRSYGWVSDGIAGAGIVSLSRTQMWKKLGPWRISNHTDFFDSSLGGETDMLFRYRKSKIVLQRVQSVLPVAADIIDDNIGTKAKIRANIRYGIYMTPPEGTFYYRIYKQNDVWQLSQRKIPISFEEFVKPIGYKLPLDNRGNLLKAGINETCVTDIN